MSDLRPLMDQNFLEYASYVIKDRAIPHLIDGLKPVQRRILYTLFKIDDGKLHKVANIIGETMKLHPHGDASIGDALVVLANKEYFIEKQGNFGNLFTGDPASASRYIEARLTPLARETLFYPDLTEMEDSYDGRNKEPVVLPSKLPTVLLLGTEGIAVGMSTSILPHNFNEVLQAQIAYLKNEPFELFPDFLTGGFMDTSNYQQGTGKVRIRAKLEITDERTIVIREVPFGVTTDSLIQSIQDAVNKGKLKIQSIQNYTAEHVEIEIKLPRTGIAQEIIKPLYAFSDCEVSASANLLVIHHNMPVLLTTQTVVGHCTENLLILLEKELSLLLRQAEQKWYERSLENVFVQQRLYQRLENCETYESMLETVQQGLEPFISEFKKTPSLDDVEKLLSLPIKRLSKFDHQKNQTEREELEKNIFQYQQDLKQIKAYAVAYLRKLLKKYGPLFPRKTVITPFAEIQLKEVVKADQKVFWHQESGYLGTSVKEGEFLGDCSSYDRVVLFYPQGTYKVIRIPEKMFIGDNILFVGKVDPEMVFNVIYFEDDHQICYAKRFKVGSFILEKEYEFFPIKPGAKLAYFSQGTASVVKINYEASTRSRKLSELFSFDHLSIKSVSARGNRVSSKPIRRIKPADPAQEKKRESLQTILNLS